MVLPLRVGATCAPRSPRILVVGLLIVVFLLGSLAWTGSPAAPVRSARAASEPRLDIGFLEPVDSLNPYRGISRSSDLLYSLLYDYPYSYDQDGNLVSNLIVSASCDAVCMNWTYTVRQGVLWSDGTGLTAADVNFTWNYDSQNLAYLWAYEPYFNQVVRCAPSTIGHCGAVISPTDPWNVTVYFQRPYVAGRTLFAPILQEAQWSIISPASAGTTYTNPTPIGTGPFIADSNISEEWTAGQPVCVSGNPNYHPFANHTGASAVGSLCVHAYSDVSSLALALETGGIQFAELTTGSLPALRGLPNIVTQSALEADQRWNYIGISQIDTVSADARLNPARFDVRVRHAMAYASNKDYIAQSIYSGQAMRGSGLVSPITPQWWYDPVSGGDNLTFDMVRANALLNESGYTVWTGGVFGQGYRQAASSMDVSFQTACFQCPNPANVTRTIPAGTQLTFTVAVLPTSTNPEDYATALYLQAQYAQIGIQVLVKVEAGLQPLANDVYSGYVDMYLWYWTGDPDPNYLLSMQSSWTLDGWNDNYWNNATYNALYIREMGDASISQRIVDVQAAQKIQYEAAVDLITVYPYGQWAMRTDLWSGWGDWAAHPYRQMDATWGANPLWFDLSCPTCGSPPSPPPGVPVIEGPSIANTTVGMTLAFTATVSWPFADVTLNWTWSWGDGSISKTTSPSGNASSTARHAWSAAGNYTVSVVVDDGYNPPVRSANSVLVNVAAAPGTLQGVVRDAAGHPIRNAVVRATGPDGYSRANTTNASGQYRLSLVPGTYTVSAAASGYGLRSQGNVGVSSGATTVVDFTLAALAATIKGTVRGAADIPVANAVVVIVQQGGQGSVILATLTTDRNGSYSQSLPAGTYSVSVAASGYVSQNRTSITVGPGETVEENFTLALESAPPLSMAAIAAIGGVAAVVAAAVVAVFLFRRRTRTT